MHKLGHYGVALLVYAPIGFTLLVADLPDLAVLGGAAMIALSTLPDVDHRIPFVSHRGVTHTIWFALLVGAVVGGASTVASGQFDLASARALPALGFAVGTAAILSHLLGDVVTPMGIRPYWPLSDRHYSLRLTPAKNPLANYGLLVLGVAATAGVLYLADAVA